MTLIIAKSPKVNNIPTKYLSYDIYFFCYLNKKGENVADVFATARSTVNNIFRTSIYLNMKFYKTFIDA